VEDWSTDEISNRDLFDGRDVLPPYTTVTTPNVAIETATSLRGSHLSLKTFTVIKYAKNAFVFQMAVTSLMLRGFDQTSGSQDEEATYDASDTDANHNNAGRERPVVRARIRPKNLRYGNDDR